MTPSEEARLYRIVGSRLRRARKRMGLTQTTFAEGLDVSRVSVVNIEKGRQRPPLHVLWAMAERLDVEVVDLIPTREQLMEIEHTSDAPVSPVLLDRIREEADDDAEVIDRLTSFVTASRAGDPHTKSETADG